MEIEYINLTCICFLTEKTVNKGMIKEFYLKLLSIILKNYYLKRRLFNLLMILNKFLELINETQELNNNLHFFTYIFLIY
jgi:hypothetical protein